MMSSQELADIRVEKNCLEKKIIIVTGAGSGIGKQASLSFAEHGATVVLMGQTLSKLESVYDEIEKANLPQAAIIPINLESASEQDYLSILDALYSEFPCIDGLLHNASVLGTRTPVAHYSLEEWNKVMQVNVTAPFLMTKNLLPLLEKSNAASILFTGSSVGVKGRAYWGAYAVSKAAQENLMQILADELEAKEHIRVNSINPGATRTAMRALAYPAENPQTLPTPKSLMDRYIYLMCDESKNINGQNITAQPGK